MCTRMVTIGIAAALLAGCDNASPALIKYEQRGACNGFASSGVTTSAGPKRAYVVFHISEISNAGAKPMDFSFDPSRLYVDQTNPTSYAAAGSQLAGANPFIVQPRTVKAGTTETLNGAVVVIVSTQADDGAMEASKTKYRLLYSASGKPGAQTEDMQPDTKTWGYTPNCTTISY